MEAAKSPSIVVLTGAGISKESGLSTFRDKDGIWAKVALEDVATPEGFQRDPKRVHAFYNDRRRGLLAADICPNAAHVALVELEDRWPGEVLIVTQNIDNLHERAGSKNVIHMHGELLKARCGACGSVFDCNFDLALELPCLACMRAGGLRPHVVWFGEMPFEMDRIYAGLDACGLFLSIGTSGNVYPAAGFVQEVRGRGSTQTIELNIEPSEGRSFFEEQRYGPATEIVPAYVKELLKKASA
ncbi:MAG: NAD-dependent protein deacylase [Alphaproteobacteria bacterium]|nr:NAD-dependent protein deacylase [Alphaproteobacteria bacterium]